MWYVRHKTLVTAILIGLTSLFLLLVAVLPLYKNAFGMISKIKSKSSELDTLTDKVSVLSQLDPTVLKDRVNVLDSALPPKKDILLYLNSIEGLSRELGLTFGGISLTPGDITEASASATANNAGNQRKQPVKKSTGLETLDTEIKMSGGQSSIYAFLRSVEDVLPLMQIKNIKVSILGNDQYSLAVTLGMLWADPNTTGVKGAVTLFGAEEDNYFNQLASYRRFESLELNNDSGSQKKQDLFAPYVLPSINLIESSSSSAIPLQ
ncbi:hypothetical protein KBD75_01220 [Candidatus Woesebacteria bacterium]|nr:hypothetical protein [Candidatus Woesebacteria bacterium]